MKKPALRVVKNATEPSAEIFLYGIIGDYWTEDPLTARNFMRELGALEGKVSRLDVHINSPGGEVWEGLAICNAIKASKLDIHTWNDGLAASMGSAILCSAKKENRHAAKGSVTMIHNASTIAWGNSKEMKATADFLDTHDDVLASIYADATGQTKEQIKAEYFDYIDHWLTAEEAEVAGMVKVEDYDSDKLPDNIKNMSMDKVAALYRDNQDEPSASLLQKVIAKVEDFLKPKNEQMSKFLKLVALAAVAAEAITADQMKSVNDEIQAEGIKGITAVLDSELATLRAEAEKAKGLDAKDEEIKNLKAEVEKEKLAKAELQKKVDAPADNGDAPASDKTDKTTEDKTDKEDYSTSVDAEAKQYWG